MFNKSLTIVLPVYNGATRLRAQVREILDLAAELTDRFGILIVDDGSTDATFEVAEELAGRYPQISVRRHRHRSGLGSALEHIQRSVRSDAVIMHDGVTPIDSNQMRNVWRRWVAESASDANGSSIALQSDICDFADLPAIHAAMERAHGRVLGFQMVTLQRKTDAETLDETGPKITAPRTDTAHFLRGSGVGQIPRLPRPKFLSAIAAFAFGE